MSIKLIMKYRYFILGSIFGLLILMLALLKVANVEGMYLFFVSIPFFVWVKLHSFPILKNDIFSVMVLIFLIISYFGLLVQFIYIFKSNSKTFRYWFFFMLLVGLNIIAYHYSVNILNSFEEGIRKIFEVIK